MNPLSYLYIKEKNYIFLSVTNARSLILEPYLTLSSDKYLIISEI
jgi:hypothetical protein